MADQSPALTDIPMSPFDSRMGLEITEWSAHRTCGRAPVEGNTQPYGLWHGGASATMTESLGSLAAEKHAGKDRHPVGTELNITHISSTRTGWVHGTATALHLGRTSAVYQVDLFDDDGRLLASARLTCRILD